MTGSLARLVARNLGSAPSLRPRLASLFEPTAPRFGNFPSSQPDAHSDLTAADGIEQEEFRESSGPGFGTRRPRLAVRTRTPPSAEFGELEPPGAVAQDESLSAGEIPVQPRHARGSNPILGTVGNKRGGTAFDEAIDNEQEVESALRPQGSRGLWDGREAIIDEVSMPALSSGREALQGLTPRSQLERPPGTLRSLSPANRPRRSEGASESVLTVGTKTHRRLDPIELLRSSANRRREAPLVAPSETEPTIQVTIGRIEVRAETAAAPARKAKQTSSPVMGLDEYLRRKNKRGNE